MQKTKKWAIKAVPLVLAFVMVLSMCLVVSPGPKTAEAGEALPELVAPGHTTHLNKGQFYVVTAEIENQTGEILNNLFARIYAKQAETISPINPLVLTDKDTPPMGPLPMNELVYDPAPVAPGTQDAGQDYDADNDGMIENGSPSWTMAGRLPPGWPNDRRLTSAVRDMGNEDDEGTGDNAWPWIDTGMLGGDRWDEIKDYVDNQIFVNDCGPLLGTGLGGNGKYSNDFCSFDHIRLTGDEPHVKQLDPLPDGEEQTVGWQIQCIGDGDVDIRVYFWEEGDPDQPGIYSHIPGAIGPPAFNCAGLLWPGNEELDNPCHDSLPDPADRDDWVNTWIVPGVAGQGIADGVSQIDEDWIWFTESQLICQGPIETPDIQIEVLEPAFCYEPGNTFKVYALVWNSGNHGPAIPAQNLVADPGNGVVANPGATPFDTGTPIMYIAPNTILWNGDPLVCPYPGYAGEPLPFHAGTPPCTDGACGDTLGTAKDVRAILDVSTLDLKVAPVAGGTYVYLGDIGPGEVKLACFELRCLQEGPSTGIAVDVTAQVETCIPQGCYGCFNDRDLFDVDQCGRPELEVEIISPADFMWEPYPPLYEGAAIHTGGEFAITARVWNIGLGIAEEVHAWLRDIPVDPKTEKPYFEVLDGEPRYISSALSVALDPFPVYQNDVFTEDWIPDAPQFYLESNDTYYTNYYVDTNGYATYEKYLGDINADEYMIAEWTLKPTDVFTESLQTCDPAEVTGFTVVARRLNGYPQASGVMIDDGPENSSIAAWVSDWSSGSDEWDDVCCNEAHCGNSFVSLQGTPMYQMATWMSGTTPVTAATRAYWFTGWVEAGSQARVVIPEPISFDLVDDIGVFVNSGTEANYGGIGGEAGDLEEGLGPYCCVNYVDAVEAVNLPILQINIETLHEDIPGVNPWPGGDLTTSDTGIRIFYQPGTPGWRYHHANTWEFTPWSTDASCYTWQYYGTGTDMAGSQAHYVSGLNDGAPIRADRWWDTGYVDDDMLGPGTPHAIGSPLYQNGFGWVVDWDGYDALYRGVAMPRADSGNLQGYTHYTWAEIQKMFDRGVGTPAIAYIKSFEIRNNHSGTPLYVDDFRIWDDFHGDLKKGDGPSEYTSDCPGIEGEYLDCNCPGIIEAQQVLVYPAADLVVDINAGDFTASNVAMVQIGDTVEVSGVLRNEGAASAWDVNLDMTIEKQPGLYPTVADAYSKHFMAIPGGGEQEFTFNLMAWERGAFKIELMPSAMDECGWHTKQNSDGWYEIIDGPPVQFPPGDQTPPPGGWPGREPFPNGTPLASTKISPSDFAWPVGNLLLVDDVADYPVQWIAGDAVTAAIGIEIEPSITAEITHPANGEMFWKHTSVAITCELANDGIMDLTGVEATLMLNDIGATETQILGNATNVVGAIPAGGEDLATWLVKTGSMTGDCVLKVMVTSNEGAMDMDAITIKVDPMYRLTINALPGGDIGATADVGGTGYWFFDAGTTVDIKAVADSGMGFAGWVGDTDTVADINDATTTVTMNDHYSITAAFGASTCVDLQGLLAAVAEYLDGQMSMIELLQVVAVYLDCID